MRGEALRGVRRRTPRVQGLMDVVWGWESSEQLSGGPGSLEQPVRNWGREPGRGEQVAREEVLLI